MSDSVRNALFAASRRLLVPLARLLLKQGVSAEEFQALVDQACVQAAQQALTERGAVVTASRITAMTGQRRSRVSSMLAAGEKALPVKRSLGPSFSQRVLTGWYEDREFLTKTGDPSVVPRKGEGTTFETLVARYGGGMRVGVIRKELVESGAVMELPGKKLAAVRRTVSPGGVDLATIAQMGEAVGALLAAFEQNLSKGAGEQLPIRGIVSRRQRFDGPERGWGRGGRGDVARVCLCLGAAATEEDGVPQGNGLEPEVRPVARPRDEEGVWRASNREAARALTLQPPSTSARIVIASERKAAPCPGRPGLARGAAVLDPTVAGTQFIPTPYRPPLLVLLNRFGRLGLLRRTV